ncbi:MAG TPA: hypothetical protein VK932_19640 [Kofleriaceae bacterium]|nr:hypothetical protein [Kofleriaceae bacterium]
MRVAELSLLLVLTLAACGSGDSDDEYACPPLVGSCPVQSGSQSYCVDIAAYPVDIPDLQRACPPFTRVPCDTAGTVGGCRFRSPSENKCDTYWWFPPRTRESVMEHCPEFLPPP